MSKRTIYNTLIVVSALIMISSLGFSVLGEMIFLTGAALLVFTLIWWIHNYSVAIHNRSALAPTDTLPDYFQKFDQELRELGFTQFGRISLGRTVFGKFGEWYAYTNASQSTMAYLTPFFSKKVVVTISTYFPDGFDVSTDHPGTFGTPRKTRKIIRYNVKTSVEAAVAYHEHRIGEFIEEHGKPKQFQTLQSIIDWENEQKYITDMNWASVKSLGKFFLRLVLNFFLINILAFVLLFVFTSIFPALGIEQFDVILFYITIMPFLVIGYTIWTSRPESVEERKKKEMA